MTAVHMFVPTLENSALCNHALQMQRAVREAGLESEVFAEHVRETHEGRGHKHVDYGSKFAAKPGDILLYQFAIGSVVADFLKARPERFVVDYQNITPASYWQHWEPGVTWGMNWGRAQLQQLATRADGAITHSRYSANELDALGYPEPTLTPLLVDFASFEHSVDQKLLSVLQEQKKGGGANVLFVGWMSPHKCQHDIIRAFKLYRDLYDPLAHLHLVGRTGSQAYIDACQKLINELDLSTSATICGGVSDGELGAHYAAADVLVCMSEHEGVGVPLHEAMHHKVPVIGYAAAAVPETVGDAGILLNRKTPALVAAAINRVVRDNALRSELIERGLRRLEEVTLEQASKALLGAIGPLIDKKD